jgi:hypothetical protein
MMKKELHDLLCEYLGELMHKDETTFEWLERERVIEKINAVNVLLEIGEKRKTFLEAVQEGLKIKSHDR